jgi:hypothetical protein
LDNILVDRTRKQDWAQTSLNKPKWGIIPMELSKDPETLGLPKARAIAEVQKSLGNTALVTHAPDPVYQAIGILLHERATEERLLRGNYTFTNKSNVVVGCSGAAGFLVDVWESCDDVGSNLVRLAPRAVLRRNQKLIIDTWILDLTCAIGF